jgi:hypothetical protein
MTAARRKEAVMNAGWTGLHDREQAMIHGRTNGFALACSAMKAAC